MKKRWLTNIFPIIIGCLISWIVYVVLIDNLNIIRSVEGNSVELSFTLFLSYLIVLILMFNYTLFRKAIYPYIVILVIVNLNKELDYITSNLYMMITGFILGLLGFTISKVIKYIVNR